MVLSAWLAAGGAERNLLFSTVKFSLATSVSFLQQ